MKLLTVGLIAVLLFSCDDNGGHEDLPKLEIDEELKDYFVHEEGTKYIMEDTAENLVDTLVITSSLYQEGSFVQGPDGPEIKKDYLDPFYTITYEAKVDKTSNIEESFVTVLSSGILRGDTLNDFKYYNGQSKTIELIKNGEWYDPRDEAERKDSLNVLGETYYNVLELELSSFKKVEFGKNIGPLRIKHKEDFLLKEKIEP